MGRAIDGAHDATSGARHGGTPESASSEGSSSDAPAAVPSGTDSNTASGADDSDTPRNDGAPEATRAANGSDVPEAAPNCEYSNAGTNDVGATVTIGANDIGSSGGDAPGAASVARDGDTP